jgi:hypothetical protein
VRSLKKVGDILETGSKKRFAYSDVIYDHDGWVDATKYLPFDFDLVRVMTIEGRQYSGWCIGKEWDGQKIKPEMNIILWKKPEYIYLERAILKNAKVSNDQRY